MSHTYEIPTSLIARINLAVSPEELADASLHIALSNTRNPVGQIELSDWVTRPSKRTLGRRILELTVFDNSGSEAFKDTSTRPSVNLRIPLGTTAILGRSHNHGLPSLEADPTSEQHLFIGFSYTSEGELVTIHDPRSINGSHVISEAELNDLRQLQEEATLSEQAVLDGVKINDEWLYNGNIPRPADSLTHSGSLYVGHVAGQKRI